jgi:hypothetical protein
MESIVIEPKNEDKLRFITELLTKLGIKNITGEEYELQGEKKQ